MYLLKGSVNYRQLNVAVAWMGCTYWSL